MFAIHDAQNTIIYYRELGEIVAGLNHRRNQISSNSGLTPRYRVTDTRSAEGERRAIERSG